MLNKSLDEIFEKNRIIYMSGIIDEAKAQKVVANLLYYEAENPTLDILLYIDSYGGAIDSFITIHDTIKLIRCNVATVCIGKAMSCGLMTLISGTKGKRFITPNSRVLIHELSCSTIGKLSEMDNDVEEFRRLQSVIDKLILKYTKIPKNQLSKYTKKDSYITPNEALKLGIVDHLITSSKILYRNIKI